MSLSIKFDGGLGNQMFQIASCYSLALSNNDEAKFVFDPNEPQPNHQGKLPIRYKHNIYKNINGVELVEGIENVYKEPKYWEYDEIPYQPNTMLYGYFSSELYFKKHSELVKRLFYIDSSDNRFDHIDVKQSVCVHVRRGDFKLYPNILELMDVNYYNKAMDYIGRDNNFIFISDEMSWVKENFVGNNIYYCECNDDVGDFTLMTMCKHNIISNSTFSWWGAYLNKNINSMVIRPSKWWPNNISCDFIFPDEWIKI